MALTIRLTDDEQKELNRLQRMTDHATASGFIKSAIMEWQKTCDVYHRQQQTIVSLQAEVNSLRTLIIGFVEADKRRTELLTQMKEV